MKRIYEREDWLWAGGIILLDREEIAEESEKAHKLGATGTAFGKSILGDIFLLDGDEIVMWDTEANKKSCVWDSPEKWLKDFE